MMCGTGLEIPDTRRVPDGYGDRTINSNPSGIGYEYGDMLRSQGKRLERQYPYPTRLIAMSNPPRNQIISKEEEATTITMRI